MVTHESKNATESDYTRRFDCAEAGRFLPGTAIEIIREPTGRGTYSHALFDFDGTLSLIRAGWTEVMVAMMVEILSETTTQESEDQIRGVVESFVTRLTGKQTIYQMMQLADEVELRGRSPRSPLEYKEIYLDRLMTRIAHRREGLRCGSIPNADMLVPGSLDILEGLQNLGLTLYLASGTDEPFVKEEADLLGLTPFFGERIYGARDDYTSFSKAMVIEHVLRDNEIAGERLLGFGDGYVELDNTKSVGGAAVGVATDEENRSGRPNAFKRDRLVGVGADLIVPDYSDAHKLVGYLFAEVS